LVIAFVFTRFVRKWGIGTSILAGIALGLGLAMIAYALLFCVLIAGQTTDRPH